MFGYAILFPTIAVLCIFRFLPMVDAFVISFSKYDLIHPAQFIGFGNFVDLLQDPLFRDSARVSLIYVVFSVLPVWPLSLGLAVLFNRSLWLKDLLRSAVFMPVVMPAVVMAVLVRHRSHSLAAQQFDRAAGGNPDRNLARHAVLHGDLPRRPAGDPRRVL
jgi:ABC-type sugar transport system permease subunit